MNKYILLILVVLTLGGVGWFSQNRSSDPVVESGGEGEQMSQIVEVPDNTVIYGAKGFNPKDLRVAVGTTVRFVNESDLPMWVGSDPHPLHTDYPEFDHKKGVGRGENYEYTFMESGTYEYHNHLVARHIGSVVVEPVEE